MNVNLSGAGQIAVKDIFTEDIVTQLESDIRWALISISSRETQQQIRLDNQPTRMLVDNNDYRPLPLVERNVQVFYGNYIDQVMIKAIEREVKNAIRELTPDWYLRMTGANDMFNWSWVFARDKGTTGERVNSSTIGKLTLTTDSRLIYMPSSPHIGLANMFAARIDAGKTGRQLWAPGRSGGTGFMRKGIERLRRTRIIRNYRVNVGFTKRFAVNGETYSHGTPYVSVTAVRKRKPYRK